MARDPLRTIGKLRRLEVATARLALHDAGLREAAAGVRVQAATAALVSELTAGDATQYAAWLPRGRMARDIATRDASFAEARRQEALAALATARTAARGVERMAERRAEDARRDAQRREALRLDEAVYSAASLSTPRRT